MGFTTTATCVCYQFTRIQNVRRVSYKTGRPTYSQRLQRVVPFPRHTNWASCRKTLLVTSGAKKGGFGPKKQKSGTGKSPKKGKNRTQTIEEEELSQLSEKDKMAMSFRAAQQEQGSPPAVSEKDFDAKLEALKAKAPPKAAAPSPNSVLGGVPGSVIDGQLQSSSAAADDDDEKKPNPVMQIGAVLSVLLFLAVYSGSDLVMSTQGGLPASNSGSPQLTEETKSNLEGLITGLQVTLTESPEDADALEGTAVAYATLGEYKKADEFLEKLVAVTPDNVDAWRLQGEVRLASNDLKGAAEAYKKGLERAPESLDLLRGLTETLKENGKQAEAVALLLSKQEAAKARGNTGVGGPADAPVDDMQVSLLLGKLYSGWSGHASDAATVYDNLITEYQDDFRGYLAKGALLKELGKAKDADRLFLQARFLAPEEAIPLVDRVIGRPASE
ncbi:hypothetical protein CYMTET_4256 [Cymbomonas tetramitiformis]|uniref:Uncharacterized protein n=1 Tax=Cymbomonas tetramitiformis TaxID=36881 RepID=A0AAE0H1Y7_9CHLO|nr:hypothetical protein CYMTET_4256 [Cymbomonas tetramitiformis]